MHFVWFSMRDGFFSPRVSESHPTTRVGFGDNMHFLAYFTLQGTLVMLNTLRKVEDQENHVGWIYLTTVLYMGDSRKYARNWHLRFPGCLCCESKLRSQSRRVTRSMTANFNTTEDPCSTRLHHSSELLKTSKVNVI